MYHRVNLVFGLSSYLEAVCEDLPVLKLCSQFDELHSGRHRYGGHHRPHEQSANF